MTDLARLGIEIDASQVKPAVSELDRLTAAGTKAEGAVDRLGDSASQASAQVKSASASAAEYAANVQRMAANTRLTGSHVDSLGRSTAATRSHMLNLSFQLQDIGVQLASGGNPLMILAQQGSQIYGIFKQAGDAANQLAYQVGVMIGRFLPAAVAIGATYAALKLFQSEVEDDAGLKAYSQTLGLTKKELKELKDVTVTAGDAFNGLWRTIAERTGVDESIRDFKSYVVAQFTEALEGAGRAMATIYGEVIGTYRAITVIWSDLPNMFGAVFAKGANAAIEMLESLINRSVSALNKLAAGANEMIGFQLFGQLSGVTLGRVEADFSKSFGNVRDIIRGEIAGATAEAQGEIDGFLADVKRNTIAAARDRIAGQAADIIGDRGDKAGKKDREKKERLSEAEKAYRAALKAAQDYQAGLIRETDLLGKNVIEAKQYEVALAAAAARKAASLAPSRAQAEALLAEAAAIEKAGKNWEMVYKNDQIAQFIKNNVEQLEFENSLIGKSAAEQELMRAQRELTAASIEQGSEAWNRYIAAVNAAIEAEGRFKGAEALVEQMRLLADQTAVTAEIMGSAFGEIGDVLGGLATSVADYRAEKAALALEVKKGSKTQEEADKRLATLNMKNTAQAISGVKSLFKEKSTAFKIMQAIEIAYAAFQAANTIAAIARDGAQTASSVANSATRAAADQAAGGAKIFSQLGVWAFPVVAAMVAVLAALGMKGGGGGGSGPTIPSAEDLQEGAGTGTVLGDTRAKSNSIANSLEIVAANTNKDLEYTNQMLTALRSIDLSISKMAGTIARQIQVSGSMFDTSGLNLGTSGSGGFLGIGKKSTTRTLWDLGIELQASSVADIIANGIAGNAYSVVQKVKKKSGFFGIGGGTKTSYITTTSELDADIAASIQEVILSLRDGLVAAADVIGLEGAEAILNSFNVSIGKISFKDMTGEQIEDQLNAIFSSIGDQMAGRLLPSLASMQLIGEGLFETFIRVAKEYEAVDTAMKSLGRTFGAVGIESVAMRDHLVQLFGGLEEFLEATNNFRDEFLTEAERIAPIQSAVVEEMKRLGLASVDTRDEFKAAVLGLDLTTEAGRKMYAALLAVAPAFDKVLDYFDEINSKSVEALRDTVSQFSKFAESLQKYRDTLFQTDAAQGNAYNVLRARFLATANLAATGDATALGGLEGSAKDFLTASKNNASTVQQYLRDVALVAQGVDKGIFAATETADYAQLQLDALENATSILSTIAGNTAATAAALGVTPVSQPVAVPQPVGATGAPAPAPTTDPVLAEQNAQLIQQNAEMAEVIRRMDRLFTRWDGDGLLIRNDSDIPIYTQAAA